MSLDKKNESTDAQTCHICQLHVPAVSKTRHEGSYLHQASLKIASTALQRLRAHVTPILSEAEPVETNEEKDRDTSPVSFCGACASVYPSIDKHIRTKSHLMAALDDQVFDELVRGYIGDEELQLLEVSKDPCDEEAARTVDASEAADTYTCYICALEIPKTFKIEHGLSSRHRACLALANAASQRTIAFLTPPQIRVQSNPTKNLEDKLVALLKAYTGVDIKKQDLDETEELEVINEVKDEEKPSEKRLTPKQYFKDIMPFLQYIGGFYTLIIDDTDHVIIKTENGTYMRVHIANFNGIYNVGDTKDCQMKCKMCDGFFVNMSYSSNGNMDKLHVMSLGHIKNVLSPIKSIHGIREIDNTHSLCVLCNAFIHSQNVEDHIMRDIQHTAFLAEALEKGKLFKESEKDFKFIIYTPPVKTGFMKIPPNNFNSVLQPHYGPFGHNTGHNSGQSGQSTLFGSTQPSVFGKPSGQNATFGQNNQSSLHGTEKNQAGFGQSTNSFYATSNQTGFGQNSGSGFGQTRSTSAQANTAFGSVWASGKEQNSSSAFGQSNQQTNVNPAKRSVFGVSHTGLFGKASPTSSQAFGKSGTFGQSSNADFGQGDKNIDPLFGSKLQADTDKSTEQTGQAANFPAKLG